MIAYRAKNRCILSKFYIKPQLFDDNLFYDTVVSYRNSTSNHNTGQRRKEELIVVSYRNSTSNHNFSFRLEYDSELYLIEILHQTTTSCFTMLGMSSCILSKFYIKPQLYPHSGHTAFSCILSKFYIKPQLYFFEKSYFLVVSYRNSTSNHNIRWRYAKA